MRRVQTEIDWPAQSRRDTSREAERRITGTGKRATDAEKVLRVLDGSPVPMTAWEIAKRLNVTRQDIAPRLCDLRALDAIRECERRKCGVKGTTALTWEVV